MPLNMNLTAELASFLKQNTQQQHQINATKYLITPLNGTKNTIILKTEPQFSTATTSLSSSSTSGSEQNKNAIFQPYHLFQPTTESSSGTK
jgi:hypothetical protein